MNEIEKQRKLRQDNKPMFVYFNESNNAVAICGFINDEEYEGFKRAVFPLKEVKEFVTGKKNLNSYILIQDKTDPSKYELKKKHVEIDNVKVLDRFITEVKEAKPDKFQLVIHNKINEHQVVVHIESSLRQQMLRYNNELKAEQVSLNGIPFLYLYFTVKDDPSYLVASFKIPTSNLLAEQMLFIDHEYDLSNTSLFTKKIFKTYFYEVTNE